MGDPESALLTKTSYDGFTSTCSSSDIRRIVVVASFVSEAELKVLRSELSKISRQSGYSIQELKEEISKLSSTYLSDYIKYEKIIDIEHLKNVNTGILIANQNHNQIQRRQHQKLTKNFPYLQTKINPGKHLADFGKKGRL